MAKESKKLGIFFDLKEITLSVCSVSDGKIKAEKEISIPTGFELKEKVIKPISLNSEFFNEKQEWVNKLKEAVKKNSLSGMEVNATLSHNFSITRFFVMPYVDKKFWSKSVPIESKKYIPVAFEEMSYDFYAYPIANNSKVAVLFGITQRKTVEFLLEVFKGLSLTMTSMETSAVSFERLLLFSDPKEHDKKVYVHFSGPNSYSFFSYNGCPVIFRESSTEASATMSERKSLDLKGSMAFVKRYVPDQEYSGVMLSGENTALWQKMAESESGLKAEILDFASVSDLKKSDFSLLAAAGASIFTYVKNSKSVDISGISAGKRLAKKLQISIIGLVGSFTSIFLILGLINTIRAMSLSSSINKYATEMAEVSDFNGMTNDMIRERVETLKNQNQIIKSLFADKDFLAPKMSVIADSIPNSLWLKELAYINQIGSSESSQGKQLEIKGETSLKGEAKLNTVDVFLKKLKTAPEFKTFTGERGIMDKTVDSSTEKKTFGFSGNIDDIANEVSGFTINCMEKKR
ncbi:MAG: hypothetical protein Fur0012_10010 [Elusimicrobiota bacterium]